MDKIRVVVTGMGAVTPLGNDVATFWGNAKAGKSGASAIDRFDASVFKTHFACNVKDFQPEKYLNRSEIRRNDLFTQYALYSTAEALEDSGLDIEKMNPFDIGVIWGTGQGGAGVLEDESKKFGGGDGTPRFSPFLIPKMISNMASGMISIKYGLMGVNHTTISACASSNSALIDAYNYIKLGKGKVFITGGSESPITQASVGGFNSMKALSTNNDNPEGASRPFDAARDGFVMGEGSATLILEDYAHAKARGAKIYAELVGTAMTADAYHITATHPEGKGAAQAMRIALHEAGLTPEDVDYINAHATSTPVGDLSETQAIAQVFGTAASSVKISGTKSMTGHLLGGAGAAEALLSIKAMEEGVVPPTINTTALDAAIPKDLHIVTKEALQTPIRVAMSNTFGFGGHNAIVIFKKL